MHMKYEIRKFVSTGLILNGGAIIHINCYIFFLEATIKIVIIILVFNKLLFFFRNVSGEYRNT